MAISTYSELQTAVANWLERDDLTTYIPDFIRLGEARLRTDIRVRELIQRDALTVNALQISLPTGLLEAIEIRLLTDPVTTLTYLAPHEMTNYRRTGTGKPKYFTIHKEIEFDITPDSAYSGEIIYYKQVDLLADTATNTLLTTYPNLYLYSALMETAPFLMHDERIQVWGALYKAAKESTNRSSNRSRRSGPQVARAVGRGP